MIHHSKDLISHSDDNRISKKKMTEIFENINKFMESNKLSNDIKSMTKERLKKVTIHVEFFVVFSFTKPGCFDLQNAYKHALGIARCLASIICGASYVIVNDILKTIPS
jgi:hypothetical protein